MQVDPKHVWRRMWFHPVAKLLEPRSHPHPGIGLKKRFWPATINMSFWPSNLFGPVHCFIRSSFQDDCQSMEVRPAGHLIDASFTRGKI